MDKYYYLSAQLPFLTFGRQAPPSAGYFLAEAKKWMSEKEFESLAKIKLNAPEATSPSCRLGSLYQEFEDTLRRSLLRIRKGQAEDVPSSRSGVQSVISGKNPLEAERELLRLRWEYIEELEGGHCFDFEFLAAYYLKLQILERIASFNKEKGREKFTALSGLDQAGGDKENPMVHGGFEVSDG